MSIRLRTLLAPCAIAALLATDPGFAASELPLGFSSVIALECRFPIPGGYILDTRERGEFLFTRPPDVMVDRIVISDYDESRWPTDDREIVDDRQIGHLRLIRLRKAVPDQFVPNLRDPLDPIAVMHDGHQQAILSGGAASHATLIADLCFATFGR